HALIALLARGASDLLGLLHDLLADRPGIVEQLDRVGPRGSLAGAVAQRALECRQRLVRCERLQLTAIKTGALSRMTGRPGRLDKREDGIAVAVHAQCANRLRVAARRAPVPQL